MRTFLLLLLVLGSSASAQTPEQYKAVASQRLEALGACNTERGQLQRLGAQVEAGMLLSAEQWKARIEAANPGKTLNEKLVLVDKDKADAR